MISELPAMLTTAEAARVLGFTAGTLRVWRCIGRGPRFIRCHGNTVRYPRSDIEAWLAKGRDRSAPLTSVNAA